MDIHKNFLLIVISSWMLCGTLCAQSVSTEEFSGKMLIRPPTTGWLTNGGDLYNQRYSPLTQINRDNVDGLKPLWSINLDGSGVGAQYSAEAQPLVHEGVIFLITGANDVFAIDVETGEQIWKYEANLDRTISTVCCGWTSRGVGLGEGKVFIGQLDGKLLALNEKTGEIIWSTQAERWQEGFTITSAPLYYDGMVITGFAGAEYGVRGRVKAYDSDDGSLIWTFYTIPGPGEIGYESWPQTGAAWEHGGATVWQTPAIDPELGLVYFSTGNAGPDFYGGGRPGDNLFAVSIVAIDVETGEYRWHYQQVHHDIWDFDSPNPVVLFDASYDGVERKGIVEVSKTGWAYILDRETGEPLIGIEERPVPQDLRQATAPTQPYPVGDALVPQHIEIAPEGYKLVNQGRIFTPFWTEMQLGKPAATGGANWPPSSYDPIGQTLYVCATDTTHLFTGGVDESPELGERYVGGVFVRGPTPRAGILAALDVTTNRLRWRQAWLDQCYSGTVVTAGGLLFVGRNDGRLTALDSDDGSKLWEFQMEAGMNTTVTVFEHLGAQFVVAYAGGSLFSQSQRGDDLRLFALDN